MPDKPSHPHEHFPRDFEVDSYGCEKCRLLKIFPDYGNGYLWQAGVGTYVTEFGGSEDLDARFREWSGQWGCIDHWEIQVDWNAPEWRAWDAEGLRLAREFRRVLPPEYTLWYDTVDDGYVEITA
jgi:hypothetical protein